LVGIALWSCAPALQAQTWSEDTVTGSCKSLVAYQSGTGVALEGKNYPGKWGVTAYTLYIGTKQFSDPDVYDEVGMTLTDAKPATGAPRRGLVCRQTEHISAVFRAELKLASIEWQHGKKPDSACAKEWQRVRNLIRTHEPKHVQDINDTIAAANRRIATHAPLEGCGATADDAARNIALKLHALLQREIAAIDKALIVKAKARDTETAIINCKLCEGGFTFKAITVDCVMPGSGCAVRMAQEVRGRTCGDPTSAFWTINQRHTTKGCGMPETDFSKDSDILCFEAGSDKEKQMLDMYRANQARGAGGWICSYSATPSPTITIQNFRLSMCKQPSVQTVTAEAEPAEDCDAAPANPTRVPR
jgi:hypothetical protein